VRIFEDDLDQFYVNPQAIGEGLGKRLMLVVEDHFRTQSITTPHLFCAERNDRAAGFYAKMGWIAKGVTTEEFETSAGPFNVPVIRFEKTLKT